MQEISSRVTFLQKFILPVPLILLFVLIMEMGNPKHPNEPMPPLFIAVGVVFLSIFAAWWTFPLKKVSIFGDKMYVSNYFKEIAIPLSEITSVKGAQWTKPVRVTVDLRDKTEFGSKITFLAPSRGFGSSGPPPIISELWRMAHPQPETPAAAPPAP